MMSIKDKSISDKQKAFVNNYCANGHNATKAYAKAYPDNKTPVFSGSRLLTNVKIRAAIADIDADTCVRYEHNKEIAIDLLRTDYAYLEKAAMQGNYQAIQARTAITRELNDITGQHKQHITTKTEDIIEIDPVLKEILAVAAKRYKLAKANSKPVSA